MRRDKTRTQALKLKQDQLLVGDSFQPTHRNKTICIQVKICITCVCIYPEGTLQILVGIYVYQAFVLTLDS